MILLYAVLFGLLAGLLRARMAGQPYSLPAFRNVGLLALAFLPQLAVFFLPGLRRSVPDPWAPIALVTSQLLMLVFVARNQKVPAIRLMGIGLVLNSAVIILNGGLMPISPETVLRVKTDFPVERLVYNERLGATKDVLLREGDMILPMLADRFVTPNWIPHRAAYSLGDIVIAVGIALLLWQSPDQRPVAIRREAGITQSS